MRTRGTLAPGGLGVLFLVLAPAAAQTPLLIVNTLSALPKVAPVGDWNGDGVGDVAAGFPSTYGSGSVHILSGHDGSKLAELTGAFADKFFGSLVAGVGDADVDGFVDVAVGSAGLPATVRVLSGATSEVLFDQEFGAFALTDLEATGDADGDGHPDLVVGGFACPGGGLGTSNPGMATLYSIFSGSVLQQWCGDGPGDHFAYDVAGAGDVDGDGHPDVVVGASENDDWSPEGLGYVRVLSGFDGATLHTFEGPHEISSFGETVDGAGDVDGDGYADILVGARQEMVGGVFFGAVTVYSGHDGSVLHHVQGSYANQQFGIQVAGPGDVDGDGLADFAVKTWSVQPATGQRGYEMYSGSDASLLHAVPIVPAGSFAEVTLRSAGDIQGDGIADIFIVSSQGPPPAGDHGSLEIRSGALLLFMDLGFGLAGSLGTPHLQIEGVLKRGLPLVVTITEAAPQSPIYIVLGSVASPIPFHGGILVPTPDVIIPGLVTDAAGGLTLTDTLYVSLPSGTEVVVQAWIEDPAAPAGFAATNAVLGVAP